MKFIKPNNKNEFAVLLTKEDASNLLRHLDRWVGADELRLKAIAADLRTAIVNSDLDATRKDRITLGPNETVIHKSQVPA